MSKFREILCWKQSLLWPITGSREPLNSIAEPGDLNAKFSTRMKGGATRQLQPISMRRNISSFGRANSPERTVPFASLVLLTEVWMKPSPSPAAFFVRCNYLNTNGCLIRCFVIQRWRAVALPIGYYPSSHNEETFFVSQENAYNHEANKRRNLLEWRYNSLTTSGFNVKCLDQIEIRERAWIAMNRKVFRGHGFIIGTFGAYSSVIHSFKNIFYFFCFYLIIENKVPIFK